MLANADENFGQLEAFLRASGLRENTIVVLLSDNGGYALVGKYNAGMRDGKSRLAEGGHRVPCFVRWPDGGVAGGRDLTGLTQVQDLLPTLLEFCQIVPPPGTVFDGSSLAAPCRGQGVVPDRTLIVQYGPPERFRMTCVMRGQWRLLTDFKGAAQGLPELYHLLHDPRQLTNRFAAEPVVAAELRSTYDRWWAGVEPFTRQRAYIELGHPEGGDVRLNTAEWRQNAMHGMAGLREGVKRRGVWDVEVARAGTYEFVLRRWPEESGLRLCDPAPAWAPRDRGTPAHTEFPAGVALPIAGAKLRVGKAERSQSVTAETAAAVFDLRLEPGRTEAEAWFEDESGKLVSPAFFVTVRLAGE
jgi:arylsulfatase